MGAAPGLTLTIKCTFEELRELRDPFRPPGYEAGINIGEALSGARVFEVWIWVTCPHRNGRDLLSFNDHSRVKVSDGPAAARSAEFTLRMVYGNSLSPDAFEGHWGRRGGGFVRFPPAQRGLDTLASWRAP